MPAGWVSAGVAVVGAAENISANQDAKSAARANAGNASTLAGAQNTMLNSASAVADQPFQAYTGTLTAPLSGGEQQGITQARQTATDGVAQQDNAAATGLVSGVANSNWDADTAAKYMNPYTKDVTDAATAATNKAYLQNLAGIDTRTAGSGAFGNGRNAVMSAQMAGDNAVNIGSLTATGNANAYNNAMSAWQSDNTTKLAAAKAYEDAGQDITNMNSTQISDLMKTGGVEQALSQTNLANQYAQFMRQQGWQANQLQSLVGAVGSAKGSPNQSPAIQSNTANQLLGLGSTVAGLFGGGSSSGGSTNVTYNPNMDSTNASLTNGVTDYQPVLSSNLSGTGGMNDAVSP